MKTKHIFKVLAFAMLLTTACTNNEIPNEIPSENGYTLPVTVNVTHQGDPSTRATYDDVNKKLSFSEGDKLFVRGSSSPYYEAGKFAGTLDYEPKSGKFSGTITTQYEWTGTANDLFTNASLVSATLLPAGYETYGYLAIEDEEYGAYEASDVRYPTKAFALTKAEAVEQFSDEYTDKYDNGFALTPQNPILSFTITDLTENEEVNVVFSYYYMIELSSYLYTFDKKITADGSGNVTFAIALGGIYDLSESSLTVAGSAIPLTSGSEKFVRGGKIYNITRSLALGFDAFNKEKPW
jgi:hypothetical protein